MWTPFPLIFPYSLTFPTWSPCLYNVFDNSHEPKCSSNPSLTIHWANLQMSLRLFIIVLKDLSFAFLKILAILFEHLRQAIIKCFKFWEKYQNEQFRFVYSRHFSSIEMGIEPKLFASYLHSYTTIGPSQVSVWFNRYVFEVDHLLLVHLSI